MWATKAAGETAGRGERAEGMLSGAGWQLAQMLQFRGFSQQFCGFFSGHDILSSALSVRMC